MVKNDLDGAGVGPHPGEAKSTSDLQNKNPEAEEKKLPGPGSEKPGELAGRLRGVVSTSPGDESSRETKDGVNFLFRSVETALDRAAALGIRGGPARVIWAYKNIRKVAGLGAKGAFPNGSWQFYTSYAMRQDSARQTVETTGFDDLLNQHRINLDSVERVTSWIMAAITCLHQYEEMVANEWRERVYTYALRETTANLPEAPYYANLYAQWREIRPYGRGSDARENEDFTQYRLNKFLDYLHRAISELPDSYVQEWLTAIKNFEERYLPQFQQQMTIRSGLEPGLHVEKRAPIPIDEANVGLIFRGRYYLFPAINSATKKSVGIETIIHQVATIISSNPEHEPDPGSLLPFTKLRRSEWPTLEKKLSPGSLKVWEKLRSVPIIINADIQADTRLLVNMRSRERGRGDHPVTLFDTGETMVFDLSSQYFDPAWGCAFSEILTNEALSWAVYLNRYPPEAYRSSPTPRLGIPDSRSEAGVLAKYQVATPEANAETDEVVIRGIFFLRKLFKRRTDLQFFTVNHLLVLYRVIHAAHYQPSPSIARRLKELFEQPATRDIAQHAIRGIQASQSINPSLLLLFDSGNKNPADRLTPIHLQIPIEDLEILRQHRATISALEAYERAAGERGSAYESFDKTQREYLNSLAGFGEVLSALRSNASGGKDADQSVDKLRKNISEPLLKFLESHLGKSDWLADIDQGRDVFINIGRVSRQSSLLRYLGPRDDNSNREFVWGIMTNKEDVMRITLRDFRSHVGDLQSARHGDVAQSIVQDYLDSYARGLNAFVAELHRITVASRETRLSRTEDFFNLNQLDNGAGSNWNQS